MAASAPAPCLTVTMKQGYAILSLNKEPVNSMDLKVWQVGSAWT